MLGTLGCRNLFFLLLFFDCCRSCWYIVRLLKSLELAKNFFCIRFSAYNVSTSCLYLSNNNWLMIVPGIETVTILYSTLDKEDLLWRVKTLTEPFTTHGINMDTLIIMVFFWTPITTTLFIFFILKTMFIDVLNEVIFFYLGPNSLWVLMNLNSLLNLCKNDLTSKRNSETTWPVVIICFFLFERYS